LKQKWRKLTDNDLRYTEGQTGGTGWPDSKAPGETREVVETRSRNTPPPAVASKRTFLGRKQLNTEVPTEPIYKLIELTGTSTASIEDGWDKAIKRAHKTINNSALVSGDRTRGSIEKEKCIIGR